MIEVYDEFPVVGNTAVMRCHIPGFVKDYLTITAWIEEPTGRVIQPTGTIIGNHSSRYLMLQSGELYIRNVDSTFNHRTYKCRARNRLTGDTFTSSSAGKLIVTGKCFFVTQNPLLSIFIIKIIFNHFAFYYILFFFLLLFL